MGNYDVLTTKRYYNSPNEMEDKDKDYKSKCIIIIILRKKHMNSARKSKFNRSIHNGSEWISAPFECILFEQYQFNKFVKKP